MPHPIDEFNFSLTKPSTKRLVSSCHLYLNSVIIKCGRNNKY